ncbi:MULTISPECIES: extracellular solute-binding protein [Paenibacillus]|uniref:ABC transporter substrate-binding protein n=2 Tax=Paenibacillus TaxID=44249 RepID=A0A1R1F0L7_9BACL|nr:MULTISPECIES: extracellular solute-binding protein [Paenibacillus]OMF57613.1 ABC transporter substrate-binding protein [Paenibacillus rhizosphaerae]OXL83716.1 ABC transporter substrate-binding protein [Paenibacillus sp. SSG-1]GIO54177.1 ABC transporter substrate-binding protein [Paenibacillus cineris]GIO60155.1 ABC transporter substrate-binding protein [Paenibacillus cineris]
MYKLWGKYALSTALVSALLLSGCSSNSGSGSEAKTAEPSEATVNETGFPLTKEPVTLNMFTRIAPLNGPFKDMPVFQDYEKMSNVHVNFTEAPTDGFQEKKNLLFASNELPDAFYRSGITPLEATQYGAVGQLIPLEDLIDKYAPNLKSLMEQYPEIRSAITTPEGHIYAIPGIVTLAAARTDKKWINEAWLKKLGLKEPETTDELYDVLVAFRDKDPNGNGKKDEIPMTARAGLAVVNLMSGSFGLDQQLGYNINLENDKVNIWMGSEKNKEMLMYLNKLYKEKLLDPELFSQKEAQYLAKQGSGNAGFFFDQTNNNFLPIADQYVGIAPPAGPHGDRLQAQTAPVPRDFGAFAISSVNKYPEITMRWIDYFYSDEGSTLLRFGREGEHYELKDGIPYYKEDFLKTDNQPKITPYAGGGAPHLISDKVASYINPPQVQEAQKKLDPYMPKVRYAAPMFDEKTAQEVNILRNDIDKYYEEQSTKFIAGALSFDKWDEFQSTLKKMQIDKLQEMYQAAYDKMEK